MKLLSWFRRKRKPVTVEIPGWTKGPISTAIDSKPLKARGVFPALGHELTAELCNALGIDPEQVRSLKIDLQCGKLAGLTIERDITEREAVAIKTVLEQYTVYRKPEEPCHQD